MIDSIAQDQVVECLVLLHDTYEFKIGRPYEDTWRAWDKDVNIEIRFYEDDKCITGIDPNYCWDSLKRSSIHAYFPMSRRELKRLIQFFNNKLCNKKSRWRREWLIDANSAFYGETAEFGR